LVDGNGQTLIVAGGGGSSLVYPKPAFQTSLTPKDSARDLPDVSFLAGNGLYQTTWVVCGDNKVDTGSQYATSFDCVETNGTFSNDTTFIGVGGTSAAAPAFAGMLALVSQSQGGARLGQADGVLYQLAQSKYSSVFHDITTGDNSVLCVSGSTNCGSNDFLAGYNAGTGYDLASGLGSVDVKNLITNWTTVKLASTTTSLQLNSSTAAYTGTHGAAINFGVGVDPTSATGVVGIVDNANENASGPLNNGQFAIPLTSGAGTASYSGLPGGKYTVSARYGGDTSNAASTSSAISVDIAQETSTTLLQVDAYNPQTQASLPLTNIPYGSFVVADAQIQGTAEGANTEGVATGTVTFLNGGSSLATVNVSGTSNIASWPPLSSGGFVALTPGSYNVTANYSGDDSYYKSVSSAVAFTVAKAAGAINVTESPSTVYPDGSSTVNVTFTTPYNPGTPPQGGVTISLGSTVLASLFAQATIQVTGNTENYFQDAFTSINASQLAPGNNTLTAVYSGDSNYASATETFNLYNTTGIGSFSMTNSGSLTLIAGQSGQEQVTVTPVGNFQGPVKLTCTSTANFCGDVQNITLDGKDSASAYFNFSTLFSTAPGTYAITIMGVDGTGKTTASTTFNIIVTSLPANAGFTVTNGGNTSLNPGSSTYGQIMVTPTNGYIGTSTVTCSISTSIANPVSQPTCVPYYTALTITDTAPSSDSVQLGTTATTTAGSYTVTVTVTDQVNAAITASTTFTLTVNAVPAIGLTNSGNFSIAAGATAGNTSTITVTPGGGFTGAVNLTCTVTPPIPNPNDPPTCSLQPTPVTITGSTAATATLTVKTTAPTTSALQSPLDKFFLGGGATLALLLFVGMPARRRAWRGLLSIAAILFIAGVIGCGGGSGGGGGGGGQTIPGTSAGTYSVTVTGADAATGQITGNTSLTVTVN
ncbi:MAG: Ig-like domain repeat protein, partial [Acidobacteriaceae bacterium]